MDAEKGRGIVGEWCDEAAGRCAGVGGRMGAQEGRTRGEWGEKLETMSYTIICYGKPHDFIDLENRGGTGGMM